MASNDVDSAVPNDRADPKPETTTASPKHTGQPWITLLAILVCAGVFIGMETDKNPAVEVPKWGYYPADAIWNGAYWALLTSVFVHGAFWHVAFNVYWLYVLGSRMERAIGPLPFLAFFVISAFVSSSCQLAVSDSTGIGASGVVYAVFGFMWPLRQRFPQFREVLDQRTVAIFFTWMVGCLAMTQLKVWEVGNAAHISGLVFGWLVAMNFVLHYKPILARPALTTLLMAAVFPLFCCPWSVTWLSNEAYNAHAAQQYPEALDLYTRVLEMDPSNAWAYYNRSLLYRELGDDGKADADLQIARKLKPGIDNANESKTTRGGLGNP